MSRKLLPLAASVFMLLLGACAGPGKFTYNPAVAVSPGATLFPGKSVEVATFRDLRGHHDGFANICIYLLPLFPYGYVDYDRPEDAEWLMSVDSFNFNAGADLAGAARASLALSGIFAMVQPPGGGKGDYVFEGTVLSTTYTGKAFSYGLMSAGPFLWMLGFPAGNARNQLAVFFTLREAVGGKLLWSYGYSGESLRVLWLYGNYGDCVEMYAVLMAEAMGKALDDMRNKFGVTGTAANSKP